MIVEVMLCMHESVNDLTTAQSQKKGTSQPDHMINGVCIWVKWYSSGDMSGQQGDLTTGPE